MKGVFVERILAAAIGSVVGSILWIALPGYHQLLTGLIFGVLIGITLGRFLELKGD